MTPKITATKLLSCTFLYFLFGWFGSFFSIEPGFASPIWPAAGVALGLYLAFGKASLPFIYIGSVGATLINAGIPLDVYSSSDWFWLLVRSLGAIFQLLFAGWLIHRFCQNPIKLDSLNQIGRLLFIAGPVACITAASFGAITLVQQGLISAQLAPFAWFTWWAGDTIGVLFFLPLTLILLRTKITEPFNQGNNVIWAAIALFALISVLFHYSKQSFERQLQIEFKELTEKRIQTIELLKRDITNTLTGLSALFHSQQSVSRSTFENYLAETEKGKDRTAFRAIGWVEHIYHAELDDWLAAIQQDGINIESLKSWTPQGIVPTPEQTSYLPITYTVPKQENLAAIGLDLKSHPFASVAIRQALASSDPISTQPLQLVQNQQNYTSTVVYYPVDSVDNQSFLGMVEVVLELNIMLKKVLGQGDLSSQYHFQVFDVEFMQNQAIVSNIGDHNLAKFSVDYQIDWFGRDWQIEFVSSHAFENQKKDWLSWLTIVLGLLIATIGIIFIMLLTGFNSQLQKRVTEQTGQLKKLINSLEAANQAKRTFLANMSHELRTPLNAIIGFSSVARLKVTEQTAIDYFDKIEHSSDLLLNAINQVLDLTKIEAGKFTLDTKPFDLQQSLERLKSVFTETAKQKSIAIQFKCETTPLPWINSDQARIEQIMTNLIGNAIKFTDQGQVTVSCVVTDNQLTVQVQDTGIGISTEVQQRLFEQFEQADNSTTRLYGGSGLGLTISKALTDMLGGTIEVSSQLEQGSCFTFSLPIEIVEPEGDEATSPSTQNQANYPNAPVLVVEDNFINQTVICEILKQFGIETLVADNGKQALEQLEQTTTQPWLILMDIQMPIMDGLETTNKIKQNPKWNAIPVVGLSANATSEDLTKAQNVGMDDYLTKPVELDKISEVLNKLA